MFSLTLALTDAKYSAAHARCIKSATMSIVICEYQRKIWASGGPGARIAQPMHGFGFRVGKIPERAGSTPCILCLENLTDEESDGLVPISHKVRHT